MADARIFCTNRARHAADRMPRIRDRSIAPETHLDASMTSSGPRYSVPSFPIDSTSDSAEMSARTPCAVSFVDAFADQQALALVDHDERDQAQQDADHDRRCPVDPRHAESVAHENSGECDRQSRERGRIFEQHRERRRILADLDRLDDASPSLLVVECTSRTTTRCLRTRPRSRAPHSSTSSLRLRAIHHVQDAGEDRHAAADSEYQDADDQRPEIQLVTVTERMVLIGQASCCDECRRASGRRCRYRPASGSLPTSMAALPEKPAARNLQTAMARLPTIAAMTARLDSPAIALIFPR